MVQSMNLRMKLFLLITLIVTITFSIVGLVVSYRSMEMSREDALSLADQMAAKYSYEIKSELQAARVSSESLMTVFKTLIDRGEADRDTLNAILQNSLKQKKYIISFCVAFEPNKLDGKDAEYAGQYPFYDKSGRYAPYWSMQNGEISVEPLSDFDGDAWYAGARNSGKEYITDPFFYDVQGTPVLMTSLVFPILINDEFIGIVSSDMALESLQDMVSHVNTSGLNEYTEIYSNAGIIVAHPEDQYFNKNIYATSVYNMLISDPSKAGEALEIANNYVKNMSPQGMGDKTAANEYHNAVAFVENLAAYAVKSDAAKLDLALLPNILAKELLQLDAKRAAVAEEATSSIKKGKTFSVTEDGYYKIYMPIQFSEDTNPWSVAVNVPMSAVLKRSDEIRNYVIFVSAAGIALIAILLYFITRNITKPILDLAYSAKQVGEGRFNVNIPESKNRDEVGMLSTAFRTMVEQINSLISRLTSSSVELKKKNEDLKELNEALIEARDQAESSNRAKSIFLSNMSHEMRTPLNAIVGMTAIGQKAKEEERKNDAFHKIKEASAHLLSLINDVLDMSKMEANKLELSSAKFNFHKVIDDSLKLVDIQLRAKQHRLQIEIDKDIPEIFIGDDFRLSQVIVNLLSNAIKFTENRGKLGLRVFVRESVNNIYTLQFEVSDTGIGIRPEQAAKLFRMFEQADSSTSRNFGGTGLGLALSKRIVEIMGGEIRVESEADKGSTFFFTVKLERSADSGKHAGLNPAHAGSDTPERQADDGAQSAGVENQPDFSGKSILLAEDIEINREVVIAMLEATNIQIDCAVNGKEAYEMFAANPDNYDAILMDIQMPVLDGVEAAKLIRALDKDVPIIALTANVFKEDVEKYFEIGMSDHIGKPLDFDLTIKLLSKYLHRT